MRDTNQSVGYGGMAGLGGLLDTISVPDLILPCQHVDMHRSTNLSGEKRLILAILEQAIQDLNAPTKAYCQHEGQRQRRFYEAEAWILGGRAPFTFAAVTEALGIDTGLLRKRLLSGETHVPRKSPVQSKERVVLQRERG